MFSLTHLLQDRDIGKDAVDRHLCGLITDNFIFSRQRCVYRSEVDSSFEPLNLNKSVYFLSPFQDELYMVINLVADIDEMWMWM